MLKPYVLMMIAMNACSSGSSSGTPAINTSCPTDIVNCVSGIPVELGDITGRVNMIALLFGNLPQGQTLPSSLLEAQTNLFPGMTTPINDISKIDPTERFASLTMPLKYRKRGVRFDLSANIAGGFGVNIQTGVANITQALDCQEMDLTCTAVDACPFFLPVDGTPCSKAQVEQFLTQKFKLIANELGVSIADFDKTSIEEVRFNAYWRHAYEMNLDKYSWPHFLLMPFFELSGSVSPGYKRDTNWLFSVPFGNDGHNAVGFRTGISFDFVETIEFACEVGATHFAGRTVPCMRIPNSLAQKTLFPFTTDAHVSPGHNWHFGAKLSAYHFLDNLSVYFEYVMVDHGHDSIRIKNCDPAFTPRGIERVTAWKTKIANIGFNYDISPNIALGFFWQAPLSQRNTYRSSTVMGSFNASF